MAGPWYVRSTDGSDASDGLSWAEAKATLVGAFAAATNGDIVYVSQAHAETQASAMTLTHGSVTAPTKVLCVNDGAEPPTTLATTAAITTTGAFGITITGQHVYYYGITFNSSTGAGTAQFIIGSTNNDNVFFDSCNLYLLNTSGTSFIQLAGGTTNINSRITAVNCTWKFSHSSQQISNRGALFLSRGGSFAAGSSYPTGGLVSSGTKGSVNLIEGFDFSAAPATINIFGNGCVAINRAFGCKMPAAWSGRVAALGGTTSNRSTGIAIGAGTAGYGMDDVSAFGSTIPETTIVRTGGATDGTTPISWEVVTHADAEYPLNLYYAPDIVRRNNTTGSAITVTVHFVHDSVTALKDDEIWLEIVHLGTAGSLLGVIADDAKSDYMATAADQTTSSETWTTTGLTNPNKQQLSVTFTPQIAGYFTARVIVAKASYTVYVCPKLVMS